MSNYITEAFKQLNLLESEDISLDASGIEELRSFLDDAAVDPDEEMDIYDLEAEAKEDLQKSYEGKVVLECTVCHSHIFEDKENISMDEDGEACKDIECPYCMSNEGYFIIGEIAPFDQEKADSFDEEEDALDEVDIEGAADDIDDEDIIEESYCRKSRRNRNLREGFIDASLNIANGNSLSTHASGNSLSANANDNVLDAQLIGKRKKKDELEEAWESEFESEYDAIMEDPSLSKAERDRALSKLYSDYGINESMKLDGVEELYDNDELRGVEELEGVDELEGVKELHGDKHEAPINESKKKTSWVISSDVDGEICRVDSEREAKATIAELKREDKKKRKNKKVEYSYELKEGFGGAAIGGSIGSMVGKAMGHPVLGAIGGAIAGSTIQNSLKNNDNQSLEEDIEDVSVTTEDETMTMTTKEDGGVVIETVPKEKELEAESEEEMIVPVSDESSEIIDVATDALDSEDGEDFEALKDEMENSEEEAEEEFEEEPLEDEDFEEFDEESFNGLGESYLKRCYENVKGFKTTNVSSKGNKLFIEGIIKFDSGNIKETQFVFESLGKGKFEGYNKQISRGKKTYRLTGSVKNNKLVCESLNYNYRSKNELNESVRVYGTVKRK